MGYAFDFLKLREKPQNGSVIEIRGSYYSPVTLPYLQGLFEIAGDYIDGFKFAGGSQRLHPAPVLSKIIKLCHSHGVYVSTGGMIERVIANGAGAVDSYLKECKKFGFDVVEVSSGLAPIALRDKVEIAKAVHEIGLKSKPEIAFMQGAGAGSHVAGYGEFSLRSTEDVFREVDAFLKAGSKMFMFESEGITEDLPVDKWRKDLIEAVVKKYGLKMWMFEAADPVVFKWYLKQYGPGVNLFIDHSQIIEFEAWRSRLWGDPKIWAGKILKYRT